MATTRKISYWVISSPMLEGKTKFLNASPVPADVLGDIFLNMWKMQQAMARGMLPPITVPEDLRRLQLYRVHTKRYIAPETSLDQQGFKDGEVLVLLREPSEEAIQMIGAQDIPPTIDSNLIPVNTNITWTELFEKRRVASSTIESSSTAVTNYNIKISHVNGPVNVLTDMTNAIQTVTASSQQDDDKSRLAAMFENLRNVLSKTPISHSEDAMVVVEQAQEIANEFKKSAPRPSALKIKASGLVEAARALKTVVPDAIIVAKAIADFISNPKG